MKNTKEAFLWIVDILKNNSIPFQISGGFAANIYGTKRILADIDIEISKNDFEKILPFVKDFVVYGPKDYIDDDWNLFLMTLVYQGQEIDIASLDCKFFNKNTETWEESVTNLSKSEMKEVYGIFVPIIPINDLISYKSKIARDVDISDVEELSKFLNI